MIILAIAEIYKKEGNDYFRKKNFSSAIYCYTEGLKVHCKNDELKATLYSNRATAHFYVGEKIHSFIYSFTDSLTYSLTHSCMHASIHSFISFSFVLFYFEFATYFRFIFLSGNFNDSLRDAKLAIDLEPCYIKAIERGKF